MRTTYLTQIVTVGDICSVRCPWLVPFKHEPDAWICGLTLSSLVSSTQGVKRCKACKRITAMQYACGRYVERAPDESN